jgi:hypothetical protein
MRSRKYFFTTLLEYTVPTRRSTNTAMVIPYARLASGEVIVFVEERDFPSVQKRTGSSSLFTIPGFRLDPHTNTVDQMIGEVRGRAYIEFGIECRSNPTLIGGKYHRGNADTVVMRGRINAQLECHAIPERAALLPANSDRSFSLTFLSQPACPGAPPPLRPILVGHRPHYVYRGRLQPNRGCLRYETQGTPDS